MSCACEYDCEGCNKRNCCCNLFDNILDEETLLLGILIVLAIFVFRG